MNILIFGQAAWDDKNSAGNTFSNFFCGSIFNEDHFSNFYCREKYPGNHMSNVNYYNLSSFRIVKGILKFKIEGIKFNSKDIIKNKKKYCINSEYEQDKINKLHKGKYEIVYFIHEVLWMSKLWLNQHFKTFIDENKPDVLFSFATSPYILWTLINYLKKNSNCKIVLLIADDVYGNYNKIAWYRRVYMKKLLRKCIENADCLYAISDPMADLYTEYFQKKVTAIYKGCDLSMEIKKSINNPIKFVYAGNLFWGRDEILHLLAKSIDNINQNNSGRLAELEIYTTANITSDMKQKLNIKNVSKIMGARDYDEIKEIMHKADVVLHVESFDKNQIEFTKYSLSTKIMDCLQSGVQVLGIGPAEIASIKYLKKIDGTIVIDNQENIDDVLSSIINGEISIIENCKKIRMYSQMNHEISVVQGKLRNEFMQLCDK